MIKFTHATTRYTVQPENAQAYRAALGKPAKHKSVALSSKNLTRQYPAFLAGHTTTAEYVRAFQSQFDGMQHPIKHDCPNYYAPAPMLDPSIPEVLEELDPDYVPDFLSTTAKPKKQTVADLRRSIQSALDLLQAGDVDMAQCVLSESLK
jgi:hypothetical protein